MGLLCAEPDLIPAAVEETLRFASIVQMTPRGCVDDTTLGDMPNAAGRTLPLVEGEANRDPEVFEDPIVSTSGAARPTTGGSGTVCTSVSAHRWRGSRIALRELTRRFPGVELAVPTAEIAWGTRPRLRGPTRLPVRPRGDRSAIGSLPASRAASGRTPGEPA